jgi:hypothetical protein
MDQEALMSLPFPRPRQAGLQVEALEDRLVPSTAAYVNALYVDLLGRPAGATESAGWVQEINAGVSPAQVALAITQSTEFRTDVVVRDYQALLGRPASAQEAASWVAAFGPGFNSRTLEASILGSNEFFARAGGTASSFVTAVFQDVLGRSPSAADLTFWSQQAAAGTTAVALDILGSPEANARLITQEYASLLGRLPDSAGLGNFLTALGSGLSPEQFIAGLAGSPEFIGLTSQGGLNVASFQTNTPVNTTVTTTGGFFLPNGSFVPTTLLTPAAFGTTGLTNTAGIGTFSPFFNGVTPANGPFPNTTLIGAPAASALQFPAASFPGMAGFTGSLIGSPGFTSSLIGSSGFIGPTFSVPGFAGTGTGFTTQTGFTMGSTGPIFTGSTFI